MAEHTVVIGPLAALARVRPGKSEACDIAAVLQLCLDAREPVAASAVAEREIVDDLDLRQRRLSDDVDGISWMMPDPQRNRLYVTDLEYTVVYSVDVTPNKPVQV